MSAIWMWVRAEVRARRRATAALTLLIELVGGVVLVSVAGGRRTDTAYARFLAWSRPSDAVVSVSRGFGFTVLLEVPPTLLLANLIAYLPGRAAGRVGAATVLRTE